jgi:hypothetical protein
MADVMGSLPRCDECRVLLVVTGQFRNQLPNRLVLSVGQSSNIVFHQAPPRRARPRSAAIVAELVSVLLMKLSVMFILATVLNQEFD